VPIQPNHCDCGIYLLKAFEYFMNDPEACVRMLDKKTSCDWFEHSEAVRLRREIFDLVQDTEDKYLEFKKTA
jgi:Ulp1 family protease